MKKKKEWSKCQKASTASYKRGAKCILKSRMFLTDMIEIFFLVNYIATKYKKPSTIVPALGYTLKTHMKSYYLQTC